MFCLLQRITAVQLCNQFNHSSTVCTGFLLYIAYTILINTEQFLCLERLDVDPDSARTVKEWIHWLNTFTNFAWAVEKNTPTVDKLVLLKNCVVPCVYGYILHHKTYEKAVEVLTLLYVKPKNEIFARHLFVTCRQSSSKSLDQFLQRLKLLLKTISLKL